MQVEQNMQGVSWKEKKLKMSLPLIFWFLKHIVFLNPAPVVRVHKGVSGKYRHL